MFLVEKTIDLEQIGIKPTSLSDGQTRITHFAIASSNIVTVYDSMTGSLLYNLTGHTQAVKALAFILTNSYLASIASDGVIHKLTHTHKHKLFSIFKNKD